MLALERRISWIASGESFWMLNRCFMLDFTGSGQGGSDLLDDLQAFVGFGFFYVQAGKQPYDMGPGLNGGRFFRIGESSNILGKLNPDHESVTADFFHNGWEPDSQSTEPFFHVRAELPDIFLDVVASDHLKHLQPHGATKRRAAVGRRVSAGT